MLNGLLRLADILQSRSWLRSRSGRLLSGLGLAVGFPLTADAARKAERRGVNEDQEHNDAKDNRHDGGGGGNSDENKNANATSEDKNSGEKESNGDETRDPGKSDRDAGRDEGDGDRSKAGNESDRQAAKRQEPAAESADSPRENDDGGSDDRGARHSRDLEQTADDAAVEDEPAATVAAPTNPNVVITDTPQVTDVDLVVEANPDVIASVSASGGFAFARSGDVTAVSGPDGASIIQSGEGDTATTPAPVEPSDDGGNNDLDFSS